MGDLEGNLDLALEALAKAEAAGADVAVMPELTLTGYPPEDLVLRPGFVSSSKLALQRFAARTGDCVAVVGFVDGTVTAARSVADRPPSNANVAGGEGGSGSGRAHNAVAVCAGGRVYGIYHKRQLPNYDVFDELRHFEPGVGIPPMFEIGGLSVGVTICEDVWVQGGPVADLARAGARLILNVNGSPFREDKQTTREEVVQQRVLESGIPIAYVNLVGGQDELVFDGGSFVIGAGGSLLARCAAFSEAVEIVDVDLTSSQPGHGDVNAGLVDQVTPVDPVAITTAKRRNDKRVAHIAAPLTLNGQRWNALVLATRDYVHKSGFSDVCIGLSGGIDSSLVATIAAAALGPEHVCGVLMPSRYSSEHSVADARQLAANLGIDSRIVEIDPVHSAATGILASALDGSEVTPGSLTEQNLQARIRGFTLMAIANENGWLVLTTGNKSELAVGYSTLYGDTAGAFAVICDLWKLDVYDLCRWRNEQAGHDLIPANVLNKAPSAELAPGQRDDQSLPPYETLDPILRLYVESRCSVTDIQREAIAPPEVVARVCRLVDIAEYKRRQSPLGPRLTNQAFGRDRRIPIINRYRSEDV